MTDPNNLDDDELESLAAETLALVTPARRAMAEAALGLQDVDAELARLVDDSRLTGVALRDHNRVSTFQVTLQAGPTRLEVDVEPTSGAEVDLVVLVTDGPVPTSGRIRGADHTLHESSSAEWPLVFGPIRSTTSVRLELVDDRSRTYLSPWIGL
ncbi:MAG: hypothetical protein GY926_01795 [bacterium]|nr:hypothetical protein [bacterium]